MMKMKTRTTCWIGLFLLVGTLSGWADDDHIAADQLPAVVQATIKVKAPNATIKSAEKENEDGKTVFEIELERGDFEIKLEIAEDGTLIKSEEEIPVDALPQAIHDALKKQNLTPKEAEYVQEGDRIYYEVEVKKGWFKKEKLCFDEMGNLIH